MTLRELEAFVYRTREDEGVNWYLFDSTPVMHVSGYMFDLITYGEDGKRTHTIKMIEERNGGKIPSSIIEQIAAAREHASINNLFALRKTFKGRKAPAEIYNEARADWETSGWFKFIAANV